MIQELPDQTVKPFRKVNKIITDGIWNDGITDYSNYNAVKDITKNNENSSGLGFSFNVYDYWSTRTYVGARLEVGSAEECRYIAEDFIDLYEMAYLPVK